MARQRPSKLTGPALAQRQADLTALIEHDFAAIEPNVLATLSVLALMPPPPDGRELLFEVFDAGVHLNLVYRVLGSNGLSDQLDYAVVFDNVVLPSIAAFSAADMAIEVEWRLVREVLFRIFPDWWMRAGGASYPLSTSLCEHDLHGQIPLVWAGSITQ